MAALHADCSKALESIIKMNGLTTKENLAERLSDLCKELESGFPKETGITYELFPKKSLISIFIINPQDGFYNSEKADWDDFKKSDAFEYLETAIHKYLGDNFDIDRAAYVTMSDGKDGNKYQTVETVYVKCPVDLLSYGRVSARRY